MFKQIYKYMNRFEIKINYEKRIMKIESKSVSSLKS